MNQNLNPIREPQEQLEAESSVSSLVSAAAGSSGTASVATQPKTKSSKMSKSLKKQREFMNWKPFTSINLLSNENVLDENRTLADNITSKFRN